MLTSGLDFHLVPVTPKAKYIETTVVKPTLIITLMLAHGTNYSVIKKNGLNFVRLYFLNYTWYVDDLHNI